MLHTTVTTMGLKPSPHALSYAAKWAQLMHSPGAAKYVVLILLIVCVGYVALTVPRAVRRRRR